MNTDWGWKRKQPTEYGWYWFRESDQHTERVIEVFNDEDGFDSVRLGDGIDDTNFLSNYVGEWCGPIPKPNEPSKLSLNERTN